MYIQKTANQLLFEGYEDPIINLSNKLPIPEEEGTKKTTRFGWFYGVS